MRKPVFWVPTKSDTNRAVRPQRMDRGLKFRIYEVGGFYYLVRVYSENKGADQLRSYCTADLRFCFHTYKNQISSWLGLFLIKASDIATVTVYTTITAD